MKIIIQNCDHCCAIRLNRELIDQLGVEVGSELEIEVQKGGVLLKPAELAYSLDNLSQNYTKENTALSLKKTQCG